MRNTLKPKEFVNRVDNTWQLEKDFKYWCLESELDYRINVIFFLLENGEDQTIDLRTRGDIKYAYDVGWKCRLLAEGLSSLQVLQKMLKNDGYPIKLSTLNISRFEWFRITHDLVLYRIAALRDYSLHLVNSVFELELSPIEIKSKNVKKALAKLPSSEPIVRVLDQIASAGNNLREDRNLLAHEGVYHGVYENEIELYKLMSMIEADNIKGSIDLNHSNLEEFKRLFSERLQNLYSKFVPEADKLNILINELADQLLVDFDKRFESKQT